MKTAKDLFLEIDHIFVCIPEKPVTSVIQDLGLYCSGDIVRHVEQGTASNVIFFKNAYLELIWIEDETVAKQNALQTSVNMLTRAHWQQTAVSPFGVGLRRKSDLERLMLSSQKDWFEWMQSDMVIHFAPDNLSSVAEPVCFVIPDSIALTNRLDSTIESHQQLISHPLNVKNLTGIKITVDSNAVLTNTILMLCCNDVVALARGKSPLLELTFDDGVKAQVVDARPTLPILLKY